MPKTPIHHCDECKRFSTDLKKGACETDQLCEAGHRPNF